MIDRQLQVQLDATFEKYRVRINTAIEESCCELQNEVQKSLDNIFDPFGAAVLAAGNLGTKLYCGCNHKRSDANTQKRFDYTVG